MPYDSWPRMTGLFFPVYLRIRSWICVHRMPMPVSNTVFKQSGGMKLALARVREEERRSWMVLLSLG